MSRVPDLQPNRLTQALAEMRARGSAIVDLTESNPTRAGFEYPADLLTSLADPRALTYAPRPLGSIEARRAVAADYQRRGATVDPDRIALTASTSEAYSLLFKILCNPGEDVLVPRPSYPLFEHLARLDGVTVKTYDLEYQNRWSLDRASVERACTSSTRALIVVHPNNPTGSWLSREELEWLDALCASQRLALIADEVFADYEIAVGAHSAGGLLMARHDALVFGLGGLSKSVGLPQAKLAWIAAGGPDDRVAAAMVRLEFACDAYLSVSTPVQVAAGDLLERGRSVREQIQRRVKSNYEALCRRATGVPSCRVLAAEAGWSAVLQVPTFEPEDDLALELLSEHGVLVHPGFFFDFPHESFLVISLLPAPAIFEDGVERILRHFDCTAGGS